MQNSEFRPCFAGVPSLFSQVVRERKRTQKWGLKWGKPEFWIMQFVSLQLCIINTRGRISAT